MPVHVRATRRPGRGSCNTTATPRRPACRPSHRSPGSGSSRPPRAAAIAGAVVPDALGQDVATAGRARLRGVAVGCLAGRLAGALFSARGVRTHAFGEDPLGRRCNAVRHFCRGRGSNTDKYPHRQKYFATPQPIPGVSTTADESRTSDQEVIDALAEHDACFVATSEIADQVGVSRQAVWVRLDRLEEAGEVQSRTTGGVRIWWLPED